MIEMPSTMLRVLPYASSALATAPAVSFSLSATISSTAAIHFACAGLALSPSRPRAGNLWLSRAICTTWSARSRASFSAPSMWPRMVFLRASLSCAIIFVSLPLATSYVLMSAFSSSFSAAISSGSDTIRMLRTRTACCVAASRIWSASDDSTAMPPVTAFMSLRMPLVRARAMIDSVASSASTTPKARANRTPIFRLVSIWISEVGC